MCAPSELAARSALAATLHDHVKRSLEEAHRRRLDETGCLPPIFLVLIMARNRKWPHQWGIFTVVDVSKTAGTMGLEDISWTFPINELITTLVRFVSDYMPDS